MFREVITRYCQTINANKHTVKIPTVEAAIALKFSASILQNRGDENKPVDNADLLRLVRSKLNLKEDVLIKLGDLVYSGGGKELVSIVKDIKAGKHVSL